MKLLTIQLSGPKGSGKTTIARLIKKALESNGVSVLSIEDKDFIKNKSQSRFNLDTCVRSLSQRAAVQIITKPTTLRIPTEILVSSEESIIKRSISDRFKDAYKAFKG